MKNKKWIIILIIELLILGLFILPFFRKLDKYEFLGTDMGIWTEYGKNEGNSAIILEENCDGYKGMFTYAAVDKLKRGSYEITLDYESTSIKNTVAINSNSYYSFGAIKSEDILLTPARDSITFNAYLTENINNVLVITTYEEGNLSVYGAKVAQTRDMQRTDLFLVVILMLLVNTVILLTEKKYKPQKQTINIAIMFVIAFVLSSYPLFINKLTDGADLVFHLLRIEGLKDGILGGLFPAKVLPTHLEGYGYAVSVFYGDLLLYFPALLRLIGFSLQSSYKAFYFAINIATILSAYYCTKNMISNKYIAALGAVMYVLAPYRLYGMYQMHTVGETSALMYMPLFILGMYRIYNCDVKNKDYKKLFVLPAFALFGLVNCHVLTTELLALFTILWCIIAFKRTFRKETFIQLVLTVVCTLIMSAWYVVPFLDYFVHEPLKMTVDQDSYFIQQWGFQLAQLLQIFPANSNPEGYNSATALTDMENTGFVLIMYAVTFIYVFINSKEISRKKYSYGIVFCAIGMIAVFMSTCYFPWDIIRKILVEINLVMIINSLQDPTRLMQIALIMLTITACVGMQMAYEKYCGEEEKVFKSLIGIGIAVMLVQNVYQTNYIVNTTKEYSMYNLSQFNMRHTWSLEEYLPADTDLSRLVFMGVVPDENVEYSNYQKKYLTVDMDIKNTKNEEGSIILPLLYYEGYVAIDSKGDSLEVVRGDNNTVCVKVGPLFEGRVHVEYRQTLSWRIAEIISLLMVIGMIVYSFKIKAYKFD